MGLVTSKMKKRGSTKLAALHYATNPTPFVLCSSALEGEGMLRLDCAPWQAQASQFMEQTRLDETMGSSASRGRCMARAPAPRTRQGSSSASDEQQCLGPSITCRGLGEGRATFRNDEAEAQGFRGLASDKRTVRKY